MSDPRQPVPPPAEDGERPAAPGETPPAELSEEDLAFIREAEARFAERYTRPKASKRMQDKMQSGVSDIDD